MSEQQPNSVGTEKALSGAQIGEAGDMVKVIALRPYVGAENQRDPNGKPYEVTRQRAAELKARGLAKIVEDDPAEMEALAKKASDAGRTASKKKD